MLLAYDMPMNRRNQLLLYGLLIAFLYLPLQRPSPVYLLHISFVHVVICIPFRGI